MDPADAIEQFLARGPFAVAGASTNRAKYGNKVLRAYQQAGFTVYGVHPRASSIEGAPCVASVAALPEPVHGLSIVTPPAITEVLVEEAARAGVTRLWLQPGAESERALARADELGLVCIARGPCVLVALRFRG